MDPIFLSTDNRQVRSHYSDKKGLDLLENKLLECLRSASSRPVILLCIGTDRSTGDSLGPLTGTKLNQRYLPGLTILGTLKEPVHAENLNATLKAIDIAFSKPYIIALDACLGQSDAIGCISLSDGPLRPGTAVKKELPAVGDIHLTGIVNINGFMQYMVLQNTRLNTIWQMSDALCGLLYQTYTKYNRYRP